MGSRKRDSTRRKGHPRQRHESKPPPQEADRHGAAEMAQVQDQFGDARSLLAVATLAMDSIEEGSPHRGELAGHCAPSDVTTLLTIALVQLEAAISSLDSVMPR